MFDAMCNLPSLKASTIQLSPNISNITFVTLNINNGIFRDYKYVFKPKEVLFKGTHLLELGAYNIRLD